MKILKSVFIPFRWMGDLFWAMVLFLLLCYEPDDILKDRKNFDIRGSLKMVQAKISALFYWTLRLILGGLALAILLIVAIPTIIMVFALACEEEKYQRDSNSELSR
jgi:hypothetical protein